MAKVTKDENIEFDFGDYAIVDDHEYHFKLMPEVIWRIKPVTSGAELKRSRFMTHNRIAETYDGTRYEMPPTAVEIRNREVALLFGGTNLKNKDGKDAISANASIEDVEKLLSNMPPIMVSEIWVRIGELYPKWGPSDPNDWLEELAEKAS